MRKADYESIASTFDKTRSLSDQNIQIWLNLIYADYPRTSEVQVADLGCGTGRFTISLAYWFGYSTIGVDSSMAMLEKAKLKDRENRVKWINQDLENSAFMLEDLEVLFMSHVLHHLSSPGSFVSKCFDMLADGGSLYIRYGAIEQIRADVVHKFFPHTVALDEKRTPSVKTVEQWCRETGFKHVHSIRIKQRTFATVQERFDSIVGKSTSVLTLISAESFEDGLRRLEHYTNQNPNDPLFLYDEMTMTIARKK
jgi:2-polyprenyl-3-methyl-5-hydroxy-6-metoxy-1,4-benzoquinol methylase